MSPSSSELLYISSFDHLSRRCFLFLEFSSEPNYLVFRKMRKSWQGTEELCVCGGGLSSQTEHHCCVVPMSGLSKRPEEWVSLGECSAGCCPCQREAGCIDFMTT